MTRPSSDILTRAEGRLGSWLRGKYRLDSVLGIGGMAAVYKATHRNRAEFAVKMLHPEVSINRDLRARFLREGYAANTIKHPGAVLVVDDDVSEEGAAFLVMELLEGVDYEQLLEKRGPKIAPEVATAVLVQLLDVLAAAHTKGIVHRDIKPANLFITRAGVLKVLDFGIARAREAAAVDSTETGTGLMLGTPAYMPPEQAGGQTKEIGGRTDIWAAGATFFTAVSGEHVHIADTSHRLLIIAATSPARSIRSVLPDLHPGLVSVIDRSLEFNPDDRWSTAKEMRDAVLAIHPQAAEQSEAVLSAALAAGNLGGPPAVGAVSEAATEVVHDGPHKGSMAIGPLTSSSRGRLPVSSPKSGAALRWAIPVVAALGGAGGAIALMRPTSALSVPRAPAPRVTEATPAASAARPVDLDEIVAVAAQDPAVRVESHDAAPTPQATTVPMTTAVLPTAVSAPHAVSPSTKPAVAVAHPTQPKTVAAAAAQSAPPTKPEAENCNPPFTIDALGRRVVKRKCL